MTSLVSVDDTCFHAFQETYSLRMHRVVLGGNTKQLRWCLGKAELEFSGKINAHLFDNLGVMCNESHVPCRFHHFGSLAADLTNWFKGCGSVDFEEGGKIVDWPT
jgi:hypothetical protein